MKRPSFFGLHAEVSKGLKWFLGLLPFAFIVVFYLIASDIRHKENEYDKLLPTPSQIVSAVDRVAFSEDKRTGEYLLWKDSAASLKRLIIGVVLAAILALLLGLNMAMFDGLNSFFYSFITFISMIPPLAILPILFISFGVDEFAKIFLIFIGIFPVLTRDIYISVKKIPKEQIIKALTLGASQLTVVYRIILPQIFPRLLDAVRLSLGSAWLFLIAAEAIAASEGLGYRIFLVRRYLAMDVILTYVLWITLIGFLLDFTLRMIVKKFYPWYVK